MPPSKSVRISAGAYIDLREIAAEDGLTPREAMERLIQRFKRARSSPDFAPSTKA